MAQGKVIRSDHTDQLSTGRICLQVCRDDRRYHAKRIRWCETIHEWTLCAQDEEITTTSVSRLMDERKIIS
jgi:hypothetical protein